MAAQVRQPTELELLLQSSLDRQKRQKHAKPDLPSFLTGLVDCGSAPSVDLSFECRCYGTKHGVVDICRACGRIVCALESERLCPHCGRVILSDETRQRGDAEVLWRTAELDERGTITHSKKLGSPIRKTKTESHKQCNLSKLQSRRSITSSKDSASIISKLASFPPVTERKSFISLSKRRPAEIGVFPRTPRAKR